jgi:hypothetical protein
MKRSWGLALGLALAVGVRAADPPETAPMPKTSAQLLARFQKESADARAKAIEPLLKAQQTEDEKEKKKLQDEGNKLYSEYLRFDAECRVKAAAIAKAEPKTETGLDAAVWAAQGIQRAAERNELVALVIENHLTSEKLRGVIGLVSNQAASDPKALDTLELFASRNPHKPVQAAAVFAVAEFYKDKAEPYGKKAPAEADSWYKKAEAAFERVHKGYAEVVQYGKRTYGEAATAALYELRNLAVGKTAPEIEGVDVDGVTFKLSDYRGKVVMLDFWGHW